MDMVDALTDYGGKSAEGMRRMRNDLSDLRSRALSTVPPEADTLAKLVVPLMPGAGVLDSIHLGREASGLWREGDYGDALDRFADALQAPMPELLWATPGGGFVPRLAR